MQRKEIPEISEKHKLLFFTKVGEPTTFGCTEWVACRNRQGYGEVTIEGRLYKAHRVSWRIHKGPVPQDMLVLHKCDNPPCVNPDHLFLGTHADNAIDCKIKGRSPDNSGEKHYLWGKKHSNPATSDTVPSSKIKSKNIPDIIKRLANGETQASVAKSYEVRQSAIAAIASGRSYSKYSQNLPEFYLIKRFPGRGRRLAAPLLAGLEQGEAKGGE